MLTGNKLTANDLILIKSNSNETLAEWYDILNSWGWVKDFADEELPTYIKNGRRSQLMKAIEEIAGVKVIADVSKKRRIRRELEEAKETVRNFKAVAATLSNTAILAK